jgi:hypothetical protein
VSTMTALARALAVEQGVAQPIATVRHVHISARPLVFVPLALAGEANAPLAAMVGDDPSDPRLLVVAQPRNRDQRFAFAAELARIFVQYLDLFLGAEETVLAGRGGERRTRYADAPQLLVPNEGGVEFVALLGRSTRFRRAEGEGAVDPAVPVLGRWLTWLAGRAENPASSLLLAMTGALARHWASGQSAVEDRNLAALAGWIDPPEGMTGPQAAAAAEDQLTWPPAGPATDPTFDNEVLARLIGACAAAAGDERAERRARRALQDALRGQLEPTWRVVWKAAGLLWALPPGEHVARRWDDDKEAFTRYVAYLREGGAPQPRRDSAVTAARRLAWLEREMVRYAAQRAHDDPLVMAEQRMAGEAFAGTVVAAEPGRVVGAGRRRKLRPLITVATADPVTIERGTRLVSPSKPGQNAFLVSVTPAGDGGLEVVVELSSGMGYGLIAPTGSIPEVGEQVCYSTLADDWQPYGELPPVEETPWTHGGPPAPYQPADEDATETWS